MEKKQMITYILFFFTIFMFSQNQNGIIEYNIKLKLPSLNSVQNPERQEIYKELQNKIIKSSKSTTYKLSFNNTKSIFITKDRYLSVETVDFGKRILNCGIIFTNSKGLKITQRERSGETFLIQSSTRKVKWTILNVKKKIGKYICYKAITKDDIKKEKHQVITAWYCPELPFSFGPMGFANLPGLILELKIEGFGVYTLKNITLNLDKDIKIKKPTKGKKVTEEEYNEISKDLYFKHTTR